MRRKIKIKTISFFVIVALLICSSAIYAFADTEAPEIEYTTVASHYFNEINYDIPYNHHGSCGYVAMSMLLSFYDTYWSDLFIDEDLEHPTKPSASDTADLNRLMVPKLKLENTLLSETEKEDISAYRMFIQNNQDEYLHMLLLSYGIERNYHLTGEDDSGITDDFGITTNEIGTILDAYFDDIFGDGDYYLEDGDYPENSSITIHMIEEGKNGKTKQDVLDEIKEKANEGIPVMYSAVKVESTNSEATSSSGIKKTRHCMIAYYADDDILLHTGHIDNPYTTYNNTEYKFDIEALWIEINEDVMPHSCSNNFNWYETGEGACSCGVYRELHPEHEHEYSLESTTETTHTYTCAWGCEKTEHHDRQNCYSISNVMHTATCSCGRTYSEQHNFEKKSARYSVCMNCGYTRDHFGGNENVHLGTKEDEETE